jgi:hypothetical protein
LVQGHYRENKGADDRSQRYGSRNEDGEAALGNQQGSAEIDFKHGAEDKGQDKGRAFIPFFL